MTVKTSDLKEFELANSSFQRDPDKKIYWEEPSYQMRATAEKVQYLYHMKQSPFIGETLYPLNAMANLPGYEAAYQNGCAKYQGREEDKKKVIPYFNCNWNDVIFFSPIHPHKIYETLERIGYTPEDREFFQVPADLLNPDWGLAWKWLEYPMTHAIHDQPASYCRMNGYQEMQLLSPATNHWYQIHFDPKNPQSRPPLLFYRIPHILYHRSVDISNERVSVIRWKDPI